MSSREEFEAWYKREIFPKELFTKDRGGNYRGIACQGQWRAWQASRQALEIAVPEPIMTPRNASSYVEGKHDGIERGIRMCRDAIEAAGVRVKP